MTKRQIDNENIEVEIQVQLDGIGKLIKHLKNKAKFIGSEWQKDVYYSPKDPNKSYIKSIPVNEWLRVRYEKDKSSVTYKNFHRSKDGFAKYCDEYNSGVTFGDQLEKIFESQGFEKIIVVDKVRKIYMDGDFEVSIDNIKNLGKFVEVEYKGSEKSVDCEKIKKSMSDYLKNIGCTNIRINNGGYPFMILFPKKVVLQSI